MFWILYFSALIFAIFSIWWSNKIYKTYVNHYLLFNVWWFSTILLTFQSPYYPAIHDLTYTVIFSGLTVFNLSVVLYRPLKYNNKSPRKELFFNIKTRRYIELFVILCYFPMVKNNIIGLLNGDAYWLLRQNYLESSHSYFQGVLMTYICQPLSMFLFVTAYYKYYLNLKKHSYTINILIAILIVLLSCFSSGGRTGLINFVFLYLIVCLCYRFQYFKEVLNINAKFKLIFLALPVIGVLFLSMSRNLINDNMSLVNLLRFSYGLYGGLLDYYYCGGGQYEWSDLTMGLSTFEGLYLFINYPFKLMFGCNLFDYTVVDDIIQQPVFLIRSEYPVNAHVSMFFRFLRDWGLIGGIFIGPLLMSLVYHGILYIASKKQIHLMLYFILLSLINYTTFDNLLCKNVFVVFLIWYFIFLKFDSKKEYVAFNNNSRL